MVNVIDFSASQPPSAKEFFCRLTAILVAWILILFIVENICKGFASLFWSDPIPIDAAFIPSHLPHPNPPGSAVPFGVPLRKATDEQVQKFMAFRGKSGRYSKTDEKSLQLVANSAAEYKGLLYQERTMKWIDDHFRLQLKNLKYPYIGQCWNGWSSIWIETGPHIRKLFLASMTIIFEHW